MSITSFGSCQAVRKIGQLPRTMEKVEVTKEWLAEDDPKQGSLSRIVQRNTKLLKIRNPEFSKAGFVECHTNGLRVFLRIKANAIVSKAVDFLEIVWHRRYQ